MVHNVVAPIIGGSDPQAEAFADEFVSGRVAGDVERAAQVAAYDVPAKHVARMVLRRSAVQSAVRQALEREVMGRGLAVAARTLIEVCDDKGATPADRIKAATAIGQLAAALSGGALSTVKTDAIPAGQQGAPSPDKIKALAAAMADSLRSELAHTTQIDVK